MLVGLGYGVIQPLIYDETVDTAIPEKTTLALAFVMVMNYLAILLSPFITDFFQTLFQGIPVYFQPLHHTARHVVGVCEEEGFFVWRLSVSKRLMAHR